MSGILFLRTRDLKTLREFYTRQIGAEIWQDQDDCVIFRHGNFLFGFCQRDEVDTDCLLTFFYETEEEVDQCYEKFKNLAQAEPEIHSKYNIYQFFAKDPEGRGLEFQLFNDPICNFRSGDELLSTRRSIRKFKDDPPSQETIDKLFENCRHAPTSMNTQGYYFILIKNKEKQRQLSEIRGASSSPIKNSSYAVAICSDPSVTKRAVQDGCIAAYHLIISAWNLGIGTCWIADMDRPEVKEILEIPDDHYVATVTPFGYPLKWPAKIIEKKSKEHFIRIIE